VAAGASHSVAVGEREVYCWGKGTQGQLGLGDEVDCCVPGIMPTIVDENDEKVFVVGASGGETGTTLFARLCLRDSVCATLLARLYWRDCTG